MVENLYLIFQYQKLFFINSFKFVVNKIIYDKILNMKVLLILLLLVPTLAMSKVYKKDGKFTLKTSSKSGFKYHRMGFI